MATRRALLIGLALFAGAGASSCMQTAVLPLPAPPYSSHMGPGPTAPAPGGSPLLSIKPRRPSWDEDLPPVGGGYPWKPAVPARQWDSIVIHHTATSRGSVESIHETHLQRKDNSGNAWLGIGYHFVIGNGSGMGDGEIQSTFRWEQQLHGAHAGSDDYNEHGIGIALVGNFEEHEPTPAQLAAVKQLIGTLKQAYGIPSSSVVGHSDIKPTACPGRFFPMDEVSRAGG